MALRPSTASQRVPLPSPPASSLPALADPESDSLRAASPTVLLFLATVISDPSFESTAASALVAELVDFAARYRLDYAASLVAESASVCPPFVRGEWSLSTDVLEDRQEEFQCFDAALPHLVSMLLAPEGDPDAPVIPTPRSYAEAIEGPYSSQWQAAMDAEMASWKSTGTYVDEVPPPGANIVSGMWIFRVKRPQGSPPVFKARYVARGFSQRQGLHSLDFSTAFLQGSLHEEIWLHRPPGFTGSFPPGTQWSLRRPVYGLRQAPREWHDILRTTLAALEFAPSTADPSLFLRTDTLLPPFYILVYVDDLVFATTDTAGLAHMKFEQQKRHTCTDLGELRSYLGLQITRDRARRTITLTQSHMVQQVLQRFDFTYSSPQATPLSTRHSLSALPSDESVEPSGPYPELVGCLMYLMTCIRPDLAYPLSILARYVAPGRHRPEHMAAAKRVLRYLCSTSGMGLVLGGRSPVVLTGHADTSWVDNLATQRSSRGYTFSLGSGSFSWRSTRSSSVLNSSCEAEIYAGAMAAQELRWLTYLLTDLGEPPRSPPVLYVDNKAMLALCREHRLEHRTKHIALRYFLARELQQHGQLRLAYVASQANTADILTKALQPCDHQRFCTMLGLIHRVVDAFLVWFPRKFKRDWVQFPPEEVREEMALDFCAIKGVPNVIGAIDGTHIQIKGMEAHRGDYFYRKSVYSMQLQVTCDSKGVIWDYMVGNPGSMQDQRVFSTSDLHGRLESAEIAPYQLVGDAAYPLKSYMLTPLHAPRRRLMKKWEQTYNYVQFATCMVVERTIGAPKGRWRLFARRHESKLWRVCAGTACIIILHNMLQTVSTPRMKTNNPRRYIWAGLPNGWWTRSGMDKYEWRSLDHPTLADLRARRHHFGKHIHRAYLRRHRVSSTAC
ncbi:unnamed protein product [Closterium sp. NIES-54]